MLRLAFADGSRAISTTSVRVEILSARAGNHDNLVAAFSSRPYGPASVVVGPVGPDRFSIAVPGSEEHNKAVAFAAVLRRIDITVESSSIALD